MLGKFICCGVAVGPIALAISVLLAGVPASGLETIRLGASTPAVYRGHPYTLNVGGGVRSAVYDGLTQISQHGDLEPALAVSWENVSPTRWLFRLRQGVTFSNGAPFDADTVVENLRYLMSKDAQVFEAAQDIAVVADAVVVDNYAIEIGTHAPDPILPRRLSTISMVEPNAWRDYGPDQYAETPVGTGPFRVVAWGPGANKVDLEAFDRSWRKSQSIKKVEMIMIPDATSRFQALASGRIDIAVNMDPDSIDAAAQAGFSTIVHPRPIVLAIALRTLDNPDSPLQDVRVRRALNFAVNKNRIAEQLLRNTTRVASQEATSLVVGYNSSIEPYEYDPRKAKALLAEAGYSNGFRMVFAVFSGQVSADTLIFQQLSQDLRAAGIDVELRAMPFAEFSRRRRAVAWEGFDGYSTVWTNMDLFDAEKNLDRLTCREPWSVICAPELAPLVDAARVETQAANRGRMLQELMSKVHDLVPSLLLVENSDIVHMRAHVNHYETRSDGILFERLTAAAD